MRKAIFAYIDAGGNGLDPQSGSHHAPEGKSRALDRDKKWAPNDAEPGGLHARN